MPSSIYFTGFDELLRDAHGVFPQTNLTWLRPRLLRQTICGTALDCHCFKSFNLSGNKTFQCDKQEAPLLGQPIDLSFI